MSNRPDRNDRRTDRDLVVTGFEPAHLELLAQGRLDERGAAAFAELDHSTAARRILVGQRPTLRGFERHRNRDLCSALPLFLDSRYELVLFLQEDIFRSFLHRSFGSAVVTAATMYGVSLLTLPPRAEIVEGNFYA